MKCSLGAVHVVLGCTEAAQVYTNVVIGGEGLPADTQTERGAEDGCDTSLQGVLGV